MHCGIVFSSNACQFKSEVVHVNAKTAQKFLDASDCYFMLWVF